jgi:hypothetical protein
LFAAVQLPDGTTARKANETSNSPSAFVGFWVGPGSEGQIQAAMAAFAAPRVMLLSPRGTFNGEQAAGQVFLDFHVLGAQVEPGFFQVKAEVLAAGERHEALLQDAGVVKISGLPSGDHRVALGLLTPAGELSNAAYASAMRTITVNRDAPVN